MGEKVDVVIVGGGLAGLSAAYTLAKEGFEVLVIEKGEYCGAKNVTGGRIYLNPTRPYLPEELWAEAPFERPVTREILSFVGDDGSVSVGLESDRLRRQPYQSYTVLRSKFDRWLAEKASEEGAQIISGFTINELIMEDGKVKGIIADGDEIEADVVIAADGVLSFIAEKAGLRGPQKPVDYAVGVKEVIELPSSVIEDRFNVGEGEGAAQLFVGSLTRGMMGGAFLYTNKESLSLGLVVGIKPLSEIRPQVEIHQLLEEFKEKAGIANLLRGGEIAEYSAHVITEGGYKVITKLYGDGILVAGEAAGFALNMGMTVRGMDFAIATGVMAARTIKLAKEKGDYSAATLAEYDNLVRNSFVGRDMKTFEHAPELLENPRIFSLYPQAVTKMMEDLMYIGSEGKEGLFKTAWKGIKTNFFNLNTIKDAIGFRKM